MCLGVGYGKMDCPAQRAIYHCQRERERHCREVRKEGRKKKGRLRVKEGEGYPVEEKG